MKLAEEYKNFNNRNIEYLFDKVEQGEYDYQTGTNFFVEDSDKKKVKVKKVSKKKERFDL